MDESVLPFDRNAGINTAVQKPSWLTRRQWVIAASATIIVAATGATIFSVYPRRGAVVANSKPLARSSAVSVAVLPFLNLSSDKEQEYFSDGITEEITSALAKVPGLTVIGRTSAFQFKGENKDLRAIGRALGVSNLIEGSVRKAGDRVRITAQLIKAATGDHVWTDSYDRNLTDIFAVQEDVAKAIAAALRVPLGLNQSDALVSNREIDPESHEDYLRAAALLNVVPQNCGVFEDSEPGLRAAHAAGAAVCWIPDLAPVSPEAQALATRSDSLSHVLQAFLAEMP